MTSISQLITPVSAKRYYDVMMYYGVFTMAYLRCLYLDAGFGVDADAIEEAIHMAERELDCTFMIELTDEHRRYYAHKLCKHGRTEEEIIYLSGDDCQLKLCSEIIHYTCR